MNNHYVRPLFLSRTHGDACAMFIAFMQLKLIVSQQASSKLRATSCFAGFTGFSGTERRRIVNKVREAGLAGSRNLFRQSSCVCGSGIAWGTKSHFTTGTNCCTGVTNFTCAQRSSGVRFFGRALVRLMLLLSPRRTPEPLSY